MTEYQQYSSTARRKQRFFSSFSRSRYFLFRVIHSGSHRRQGGIHRGRICINVRIRGLLHFFDLPHVCTCYVLFRLFSHVFLDFGILIMHCADTGWEKQKDIFFLLWGLWPTEAGGRRLVEGSRSWAQGFRRWHGVG